MAARQISFRRMKRSFITVSSFTSHAMRRAHGVLSRPISASANPSPTWILPMYPAVGSSAWIRQIVIHFIEQLTEARHGFPLFRNLFGGDFFERVQACYTPADTYRSNSAVAGSRYPLRGLSGPSNTIPRA